MLGSPLLSDARLPSALAAPSRPRSTRDLPRAGSRSMDASMARLLTANSTLRAGRACVDDLSDDTLTEIASYLTAGDVGKLAQVSRRFASVGADRVVWQGLLDRDFGDGGARRTRSARPGAGGGGGNGRGEGGGMGMTRDASRMASYGSMLMHSLGQSGKRMFGRVGGGGGSGGALAAAAAGVGSYRPVNNDVEAGFAGSAAGAGGAGAGSGGSGYGASGSSAAAAAGPDPRAAYMSRFGEVRTGRQKARAATADATALAAAKHRARKLRVCLDACTYFAGLGLPCALIGLTILLIVLKAANKVALGWESVFAPLWLGCGACFSACVVGCCVQCCSYGVPQESIWRDQEAGEAMSAWGLYFRGFHRSDDGAWRLRNTGCKVTTRSAWLGAMLFLGFIAFPTALYWKLSGAVASNWGVIFLPVWLCFLLWCCYPCVMSTVNEDFAWSSFAVSLFLTWAPLLVFCIMVVVRLNGRFIASAIIAIPLWIVDAILLMASCIFAVFACVENSEDGRRMACRMFGAILTLLLVFVPAQVLAAYGDAKQGTVDPLATGIPLAIGGCVLGVAGFVFMRWAWRRRAEDSSAWSGLYRAETWRNQGAGAAGIIPGIHHPTALR